MFWARHLKAEADLMHFNNAIFICDYVDYYGRQPSYIDRFFQSDRFGSCLRSQPWGSEQVEFLCQKASESGNFSRQISMQNNSEWMPGSICLKAQSLVRQMGAHVEHPARAGGKMQQIFLSWSKYAKVYQDPNGFGYQT